MLITRGMGSQTGGTIQYIDRGSSSSSPPKIIYKEQPFPIVLVRNILTKDEEELNIFITHIYEC